MNRKIKIAIAEDDMPYRFVLVTHFNRRTDFEVIIEASNGKELIDALDKQKPDIVLLDLIMPLMNGRETLTYLVNYHSEIKILMLTIYDNKKTSEKLLQQGANGFLSKTLSLDKITDAISDLYFKELNTLKEINNNTIFESNLNENEKTVIQYLCKGFSSKKVADEMSLSKKTIDHYRERIYKKTETTHIAELAIYAYKNNLL